MIIIPGAKDYFHSLSLSLYIYIYLVSLVFTNGPGEIKVQSQVESYQGLKKKVVLEATLLNTQHYKIQIKGKMEQSRERSSALPYTSV